MSEGEQPKSRPPPDRAHALARKLSSGRHTPPELEKKSSSAGTAPAAQSESPADTAAANKRDAMLASRRASVQQTSGEPAREVSERPKKKPAGSRKGILALGGVLLLVLLAVAGFFAKQSLFERSAEGRVHAQLLAWEFSTLANPAAREAAFVEIDRMGPAAVSIAINKLTDASTAQTSSSHSARPIQHLAHFYLLHFASTIKAPPPKEATELAKALFEGAPIAPAQWLLARDAWRAWLADQQARGAVPK